MKQEYKHAEQFHRSRHARSDLSVKKDETAGKENAMKKKLLKKLMVLALSAVTAFSAVPAATVTAAGNPYPTTQDVDRDGLYEIPCTRFAWQCVCRGSHCLHGEMR